MLISCLFPEFSRKYLDDGFVEAFQMSEVDAEKIGLLQQQKRK
jgi:hypothetical protein